MKILRIIGSLNPELGGPVEVSFQQTVEMIKQGHQVDVLTLDGIDAPYVHQFPGNVIALGPSFGKYRFNQHLIPWLLKNSHKYDLVVVHGIWQFLSSATWLVSRMTKLSYFVYTHGALDPWFRSAYPLKHVKKWVSWQIIDHKLIRDAAGVLFTSEEERMLASKSFLPFQANEIVVDYGTAAPPGDLKGSKEVFLNAFPQLRGKKIFLFLSRIHPKKGCDLLIEAFAQLSNKTSDIQLVIAGPDQTNWIPKLKVKALKLGINDRITWAGMLTGDLKWGAFYSSELFILPSHSENFGVVLAEAMACRVPVLTTNKVNIWREIQKDGSGIIGNDDLNGVVGILEQWLGMTEDARHQMRENAEKTFWQRYEISGAVKKMLFTLQTQTDIKKLKMEQKRKT